MKNRGVETLWDVVHEGGNGTDAQIDLYKDPDWAEGYDVVIHNECFANTADPDYIRRITGPHHAGTGGGRDSLRDAHLSRLRRSMIGESFLE